MQLKMITLCDWGFKAKVIIVCDSFFRKQISIVRCLSLLQPTTHKAYHSIDCWQPYTAIFIADTAQLQIHIQLVNYDYHILLYLVQHNGTARI